MSRKDYQLIADAIRGAVKAHGPASSARLIADNLCILLRRDNPRFDEARFMAAAGFPAGV